MAKVSVPIRMPSEEHFSAMSTIPQATIDAYLETHYHVFGDSPTSLQIGIASAVLAEIHRMHRVSASAFITAWNPLSQALSGEENAARQRVLALELTHRGLAFIDGIGQHPLGTWPGEASCLVLGCSLDVAKELGEAHGQNAIVWSGADAVPQIVLLR